MTSELERADRRQSEDLTSEPVIIRRSYDLIAILMVIRVPSGKKQSSFYRQILKATLNRRRLLNETLDPQQLDIRNVATVVAGNFFCTIEMRVLGPVFETGRAAKAHLPSLATRAIQKRRVAQKGRRVSASNSGCHSSV